MLTIRASIVLLVVTFSLANFAISHAHLYPVIYNDCSAQPDNATTEAFKTNLNDLLSKLKQKAPQNKGFYNLTIGNNTDRLYGLAQCRGDLPPEVCSNCLHSSVALAFSQCANSNTTEISYSSCFLRYSHKETFGQWSEASMPVFYPTTENTLVAGKRKILMKGLVDSALADPLMFKTGSVDVGDAGKRYGLVQCNRDLNTSSCASCLKFPLEKYYYDDNRSPMFVYATGCAMWYDSYRFYYNSTSPPEEEPDTTPGQGSASPLHKTPSSTWPMQIATLGTVLVVLITGAPM